MEPGGPVLVGRTFCLGPVSHPLKMPSSFPFPTYYQYDAYLTSLCLRFPICEMGVTTLSLYRFLGGLSYVNYVECARYRIQIMSVGFYYLLYMLSS